MRQPLRLIAFVLALAALLPSAHASSVNRVAFLGISGTGGAAFTKLLDQDLSDAYTVLSADTYRNAAQQIGHTGPQDDDVRAVCGVIRADVLIVGSVRVEANERVLYVSLRDGVTGRVVTRLRYSLAGTTLPQMRDKVVMDIVLKLSHLQLGAPPPSIDSDSDDKPVKSTTTTTTTTGSASTGTTDGEEPLVTTKKQPNLDRTWRGLTFGVGPTLTTRALRFDNAAAGYSGGTVYGLAAYGAVFPVALSAELANSHPVLASFGLEAEYEHIGSFRTTTQLTDEAGHASRWFVRFLGRIPLGKRSRGGTLTLSTGYQQLDWGSSSPTNLSIPNVGYGLVDFGLEWERTLGTRFVGLGLRLGGLVLAHGGGITSPDEYGAARGGGVDATVRLQINPTRWFWLRLQARLTAVLLEYHATGARFATSSNDRWLGGSLEVGFAL